MLCINNYVSKEIRINVRTTEDIKRDIEITAKLRGLTVSSLINSLAVKAIREEKQLEPKAFEQAQTVSSATEKAGNLQIKEVLPPDVQDYSFQVSSKDGGKPDKDDLEVIQKTLKKKKAK